MDFQYGTQNDYRQNGNDHRHDESHDIGRHLLEQTLYYLHSDGGGKAQQDHGTKNDGTIRKQIVDNIGNNNTFSFSIMS